MSMLFDFNTCMKSCLSAIALVGRGLLKIWGRSILALERPLAAFLAILSASSLPFTLLCPEIHLMVNLHPNPLMADRSTLTGCCPEAAFGCSNIVAMDWLSVYIIAFFPIDVGVFSRIHSAKMTPTISALNMLCFSEVPMKAWSDLRWRVLPFLYKIADAPMPPLRPDPSVNSF
jgi:hypothetical protein